MPSLLLLLPLLLLLLLLSAAVSMQGKEKFVEQFMGDGDEEEQQQEQQQLEAAAAAGHKTKGAPKPAEHRALFAGNLDDHFRCVVLPSRSHLTRSWKDPGCYIILQWLSASTLPALTRDGRAWVLCNSPRPSQLVAFPHSTTHLLRTHCWAH